MTAGTPVSWFAFLVFSAEYVISGAQGRLQELSLRGACVTPAYRITGTELFLPVNSAISERDCGQLFRRVAVKTRFSSERTRIKLPVEGNHTYQLEIVK